MIVEDVRNEHITDELLAFFKPQTVAIIGASQKPNKVGYKILENLIRAGYTGKIIPVNPSADSILGKKCYRSLLEFGDNIDQSVIVVPRAAVMDSVKESIASGAKAITVITAGFKEQDSEGAELEKELAKICNEAGVSLLGPNCLGHLNTHFNMDLSFGKKWPSRDKISFVSQSGALCSAVLDRAVERGFGLAKMISIGNKAGLGECELLAALAEDSETNVIVCYLESIDAGQEFVKIAEKTSEKKPVIIFKSGVTKSGSRAASSHTGSLAGADIAYDTAFKKCGIIRTQTYEQMFEYATAFSSQPLPAGNRVAVITNAGGPGIMATDAIELNGLKMADLHPETTKKLKAVLPGAASVKNPVDVLGDADPQRYALALQYLSTDPNVDAIIILLTPQAVTDCLGTAEKLCDVKVNEKPVLACFLGGEDVAQARNYMLAHNLPDYRSPEKAVNVLKAMNGYAQWRNRDKTVQELFKGEREKVTEIIKRYRQSKEVQINEADAKSILRAYGIKTPDGALVTNSQGAVTRAEKIGFPLVMKIVSPDIIHKSDVGGVVLNLQDSQQVAAAFDSMIGNIKSKMPDARIRGVYIEKMCPSGSRETIIGMMRDPQFGPMVMFGLGGIFVELLKDVKFALAPVSEKEALEMMKQIKTYPLLASYRGQPGVDVEAIARTISRVSCLANDFPEIKELDINPFMAFTDKEKSVAADARMTLI
ncbi:MAG TPA: acetate--CoA ligase family protein [Chitinispirillaceae bacterium]|nr:acetate--CoA ligase family protein [Chitinispirillaceae bacterium]